MKFGDKFKQLRITHGYTQKVLSERLGVSISAISEYESGDRNPTLDNLIRIARIFHVTTDYLLDLDTRRVVAVDGLPEETIAALENLIQNLQDTACFHKRP